MYQCVMCQEDNWTSVHCYIKFTP